MKVLSKILFLVAVLVFLSGITAAKEFKVSSPDKRIEVKVNIDQNITYSVTKDAKPVFLPSELSMTLQGGIILGAKPDLK
jgi:alpha-glucosidase